MKYDRDLEFLQYCPNEQLKTLCDIMTHDEDGELRYSEQLTDSDEYLAYYPDNMQMMWKNIAGELQKFGGNTIMNFYRHGEGVLYADIVDDICRKLKVDFDPSWQIADKEQAVVLHLVDETVENLSDEERLQLLRELDLPTKDVKKQAILASIQLLLKKGGSSIVACYATIIANYIARLFLGRGTMAVASGFVGRALSVFTGPIGWAATAAWTASDIAAPAYRVTIPAVLQIAFMRAYANNHRHSLD